MSRFLSIIIILFAIIGVGFSSVFVAMQFGLLNVRGTISERNQSLRNNVTKLPVAEGKITRATILCKIHVVANYAPETARNIYMTSQESQDVTLIQEMINVGSRRFIKEKKFVTEMEQCSTAIVPNNAPPASTAFAWADSEEWAVIKSAFIRDREFIDKAAKDSGVSPRILLGGIIGEQFRFFTNARDSFKRYFEPLKILASLSQFSFGIGGLKPETVARIDQNLKSPESVFYLGKNMENIITYESGANPETVRFERITDTKNTYYSYLYAGLFMRQVIAQWGKSGHDISKNPGVLATLYNLGFNRSIPKSDPQPGGAPIVVNGQQYTFGDLAHEFYYSGELVDIFPY